MTGGDFLVLTPWALFTAGLAVVSVLLRLRPRRGPAAPGTPRARRGGSRGSAAGPGRRPGPASRVPVMTEAAGTALAARPRGGPMRPPGTGRRRPAAPGRDGRAGGAFTGSPQQRHASHGPVRWAEGDGRREEAQRGAGTWRGGPRPGERGAGGRPVTGLAALTSLAVASPVSYLAAVAIPALDALIPLLPSETAVIALAPRRLAATIPASPCWSPWPRAARSSATTWPTWWAAGSARSPAGGCSPGRAAASGWTGPGGRWNGTAPASSWPAGSSRADAPR